MNNKEILLSNLDRIHTTDLGVKRIKENLNLEVSDVVSWCLNKIKTNDYIIKRVGKNWYLQFPDFKLTINAHSYTIITAHKYK